MKDQLTTAELDAIRAAAEAATPGPWSRFDTGTQFGVASGEVPKSRSYLTVNDKCVRICCSNQNEINALNMDFIAIANPATVLRLVEQARPMEWKNEYPDRPGLWIEYMPSIQGSVVSYWDQKRIDGNGEHKPRNLFYGPLPKPPEAK